MATYVALLRGINVGGKTLPMAGLRTSLTDMGFEDVVTYIQSGNVVFDSGSRAAELRTAIEKRINDDFGLAVTVILRTPPGLDQVVAHNPFGADEPNLARLHVMFLEAEPASGAVSRIEPDRSPGDRFQLNGRELYLHLPDGAGRSKMTLDYLERRLGVRGTMRNWNTLLKLLALARER
jgi:uncharacterized protein (DUF1697 family)